MKCMYDKNRSIVNQNQFSIHLHIFAILCIVVYKINRIFVNNSFENLKSAIQ